MSSRSPPESCKSSVVRSEQYTSQSLRSGAQYQKPPAGFPNPIDSNERKATDALDVSGSKPDTTLSKLMRLRYHKSGCRPGEHATASVHAHAAFWSTFWHELDFRGTLVRLNVRLAKGAVQHCPSNIFVGIPRTRRRRRRRCSASTEQQVMARACLERERRSDGLL